ncbi:MAG: DAK2 domain-containing protein [Bacilli bacterium]|nr:DAK2 domain-containing protein [Bacilli bacterium]
MNLKKINGSTFSAMLENGYKNLLAHLQIINDLNVFPVPDGDTGTNMKLTYQNGLKTITDDDAPIDIITDEFARGMLFGARGNSGVLTSQYFRGFADACKGKKELTVDDFAKAMISAYKNAYNACADVAEGTILTVARESIENTIPSIREEDTFDSFLTKVVSMMRISLDNTPNLLSVLKENGVVDSGGKGLLTIYEGYLAFFTGKDITVDDEDLKKDKAEKTPSIDFSAFNENSTLDYGYCTEFLLQLLHSKIDISKFNIDEFIAFMQEHGNSLVCFQTGTIVKVHVHTKKPYEVIEYAQRFGEFITFKMENMALQHNSLIKEEEKRQQERKKIAVITIAQGDGIIDLFQNQLRADLVINGGTTMNTSVSEMIDAFKYVNADEIILLPNETNMLKAAQQAAELYKDSKVYVVNTHNIQEGFAALNMYMGTEATGQEVYEALKAGAESVTPYIVFKSGKDAKVGSVTAPKGSYVGSKGKKLITFAPRRTAATLRLFEKIEGIKEKEVCFIIYGQTVLEDAAEELISALNEMYPNLEVALINGKQDVYDLLIGIY